ncbi:MULTISPECIES: hypothetical protein [Haloferax]|nr:hypothetical protein [Haloferax mediterranei]MDX5989066.1 hypothetical protein [Haloferax mediterranei ATCC 33500]
MSDTISPIAVFVPAVIFGGVSFYLVDAVSGDLGLSALGAGIGVVIGVAIGVTVSRRD